ncbi:MAG TPA: hypothetical protein VLI54_05470 [Bacillota bacterium]|nr:hypothetical protein [Bacillota bacterium]
MISHPSRHESTPEEFLSWEVAGLELFDEVTRYADLKSETSRLQRTREGASKYTIERRYWPIAVPSSRMSEMQRRSEMRITLTEKQVVFHAVEEDVPTVVRRAPGVRQVQRGVGSFVLERPELVRLHFPDGDQSPWGFARPEEIGELGGDAPFVGQQEIYIATLQRALGALVEAH